MFKVSQSVNKVGSTVTLTVLNSVVVSNEIEHTSLKVTNHVLFELMTS